MTPGKWLVLAGGFFLLVGLTTALLSGRYASRVMGRAGLGVAIFAPAEGSAEWHEKERLRRRADCLFYVGLVLTAIGVVLQTLGGIL